VACERVKPTFNLTAQYCIERLGMGYVLLTQYCTGDKIEKNGMDGACSTYEGEERCIQSFGGES